MPKTRRQHRIQHALQRDIAQLVDLESRANGLPRLTITGVDVAPDLSQAIIYYALDQRLALPENFKETLQTLSKRVRHTLAKSSVFRRVPLLIFTQDPAIIKGRALDEALARLSEA